MDVYIVVVTVFGAIVLFTAWLPMLLKDLPLSLPIACIGLGMALVYSPLSPILAINPLEDRALTERLTEFVVIIALMGAGLKLDRPFAWRSWMVTWRLLAIAMPLTIAAIALLGWSYLGLGVAGSILLGAALAPTDPVLASDIQVGPPNSEEEDEVRFALTSEAGLNDGLAFPFVYMAIAIALSQVSGEPWLGNWLLVDVAWKLGAGVVIGWACGRLLGHVAFQLPERGRLSTTGDGLVAVGITCLCYGLTETCNGYGFLAVFVAGVTIRSVERKHRYHKDLHTFTEQVERLFMMLLLVCFGAAIAEGSIFGALSWTIVVAALAIVLVIRPVAGMISLAGSPHPLRERAVIAFFGIRGLGSFYYLAYALGQAEFQQTETLWVTVCLVVLVSIVLHGVAVTPVMGYLDRGRAARIAA